MMVTEQDTKITPPDRTIRSATRSVEDVAAVKRLLEYGVSSCKVLPRTDEELDELIGEGHLYVAEKDGQIVGVVALEVYSQRLVEIRSLVVDPSSQRQGIGTLLVETCLAEAKRLRVREVLAVTDRTPFFNRLGFSNCLDGQEPLFVKL